MIHSYHIDDLYSYAIDITKLGSAVGWSIEIAFFLSSINQEIVQRESSVSWSDTNYGTSYSDLIYRHVPETQTSVKLALFIRRGHAKTDYIRWIVFLFFFFLPYFILLSLAFLTSVLFLRRENNIIILSFFFQLSHLLTCRFDSHEQQVTPVFTVWSWLRRHSGINSTAIN